MAKGKGKSMLIYGVIGVAVIGIALLLSHKLCAYLPYALWSIGCDKGHQCKGPTDTNCINSPQP